ncbi:MAG TPA: hypothetical protein VNZ86_04150 [Bacteroidia bacterium]|nr:hypothetical protein [Bacteroidia bacterium]
MSDEGGVIRWFNIAAWRIGFHGRKGTTLKGKDTFLVRNATTLKGKDTFLVRNETTLTGKDTFLVRKGTTLEGIESILSRADASLLNYQKMCTLPYYFRRAESRVSSSKKNIYYIYYHSLFSPAYEIPETHPLSANPPSIVFCCLWL